MLDPTNCILLANGVRYHQSHCQYHQYDTESLPRGKSFQIQNHLLEIFSICFKFLVEFVLSNRFHHILEVLGVVKRGHWGQQGIFADKIWDRLHFEGDELLEKVTGNTPVG